MSNPFVVLLTSSMAVLSATAALLLILTDCENDLLETTEVINTMIILKKQCCMVKFKGWQDTFFGQYAQFSMH